MSFTRKMFRILTKMRILTCLFKLLFSILVQNSPNVTKKVLVFWKVARSCSLTKKLLKILKVAKKLPSRIWKGLLAVFSGLFCLRLLVFFSVKRLQFSFGTFSNIQQDNALAFAATFTLIFVNVSTSSNIQIFWSFLFSSC